MLVVVIYNEFVNETLLKAVNLVVYENYPMYIHIYYICIYIRYICIYKAFPVGLISLTSS